MGMLLAWTVSTATTRVFLKSLGAAFALLSFKQVVGLVPLNSAPLKSVGPALVGSLVDEHSFASRARSWLAHSSLMTVFESIAVIEFIVKPI